MSTNTLILRKIAKTLDGIESELKEINKKIESRK